MRKIITSIFIATICFSCVEENESLSSDTRFYVPQLNLERGNLKVDLNFIDPRPFTSYAGGPPSAPDVIDVFLSTDNENYKLIESVDSTTTELAVDGLSNGQLYYFRLELSRGNSETLTTIPVMTVPVLEETPNLLISNIDSHWSQFAVSSDRSFVTFRNRPEGLNLRNVETGAITFVESDSYGVNWARNSNNFVYFNTRIVDNNGANYQIKQKNAISGAEQVLVDNLSAYRISNPVYSADDQTVYYLAGLLDGYPPLNIWQVDVATKENSLLINLEAKGFTADQVLSLSGDGENFYLDGRDNASGIIGIYELNLATEQIKLILESTRGDSWPSISPNGDKLAFVSNRSGKSEIWMLNLSTGKLNQLTGGVSRGLDFDNSTISWYSNNEIIVPIIDDNFNRSIEQISTN